MIRLAIYILPLILCLNATAQKIKVNESVRQDWSGGVAGKRGSNYSFTLEFQGITDNIVADTIWIGNEPIVLVTGTEDTHGRNCFITKSKNKISVRINAGISRDDYALTYRYMEQKEEIQPEPPIKHAGVALLCYRHGNKKNYYVIPKIITTLPQVNYP